MDKMISLAKFDGWELGKTSYGFLYLSHGDDLFTDVSDMSDALRLIPEFATRQEMSKQYFNSPQVDSDSTWPTTDIEVITKEVANGRQAIRMSFPYGPYGPQ